MKPKQFFFVCLGLVVVVLGAGGAGVYYGLQYEQTQSTALGVQLAVQQAAVEQIIQVTKIGAEYQKDVVPVMAQIDDALPRQKDQTDILAQIERIATDNGVALGGVTMPGPTALPSSVSQTVADGTVLALPINFNVSSTYGQLQSFTAQLESLNRYTNITTLIVQSAGGGNATYTYNLDAYIKP